MPDKTSTQNLRDALNSIKEQLNNGFNELEEELIIPENPHLEIANESDYFFVSLETGFEPKFCIYDIKTNTVKLYSADWGRQLNITFSKRIINPKKVSVHLSEQITETDYADNTFTFRMKKRR